MIRAFEVLYDKNETFYGQISMKTHYCAVLDQEGQTPLHIAASAGHIQLVDALIQAGCDVTVQDFVSHNFLTLQFCAIVLRRL